MKKSVSDIKSLSDAQAVRNSEAVTFTRLSHNDLFNKILLNTCRAVSIETTQPLLICGQLAIVPFRTGSYSTNSTSSK